MAKSTSSTTSDEYLVRRYDPADREAFLRLYGSVFDKQRSDEWVEWRYGGPYTDGVRMVVTERDGELVGAEPFISLSMHGGDETVLALQPADAMVHPDHRRNGLLTRMTERAIEAYGNRRGFFFNFPNESAEGVYLRLGWRAVGETATAYRVHAPSAFSSDLGTALDGVSRGCYRGYDTVSRIVGGVRRGSAPSVHRYEVPPVDVLASLYERAPPERIHAPRTAEFYRWRLSNPEWDVETYVAETDGGAVAALVVATQTSDGLTMTKVLDAVPLVDPDVDAIERLLAAVVSEHRSVDAVAVAEDTFPPSVLRRLGFLRDDRWPLSLVSSPTSVVARPFSLGGRNWTVGGRRLSERPAWTLSFAEQDTSV